MMDIYLPDGALRTYPQGSTGLDVAQSISEGLARKVLAVEVNGEVWDATRPLPGGARIRLLRWEDEEGKSTFWHSSAHLMAEAIRFFYPRAKLAIGPPIENGFYYDIDLGGEHLGEEDLPRIEAKMKELARERNPYIREMKSKAEAMAYFESLEDPYKLELLEDLEDGQISFYTQGQFVDLCRGPHIPHTGLIKAVKITHTAGAYWRGDEKRPMLTRVYGISFPAQKELDQYLAMVEEAKKRDHRKLGKEMGLFHFSEKVGSGLPLWLPKGAMIRERLQTFLQNAQKKDGYLPVITPHIGSRELYETSGHWEKYGQDSYRPITTPNEGESFLLKPMNCPHHCEIYKSAPRSYRDLPLRFAEFGTVYRYEQSGELHGLTRVRGFTQDDAHLFCRPEQLGAEFEKVIDLVIYVLKSLDFEEYTAQISLRDPQDRKKYIGTDEHWAQAESAIMQACQAKGLDTVTVYGEAAFYGPKLDFMVRDALGRKWQLGTIQVDYNLPERFDLEYVDADNIRRRPVMIHRAPFGSLERFVAVLLEHSGGNLPLWLAPVQVKVLPLSDKYLDYARSLAAQWEKEDIRVDIDERQEKMGRKIRDAEIAKVPYMVIVGEKEAMENLVSVRAHGGQDLGAMDPKGFRDRIQEEVRVGMQGSSRREIPAEEARNG